MIFNCTQIRPYIDWTLECRLVALDRPSMKLLRSQMCDPILQQNAAREGAASKRFHPIDCLGAKLDTSPSLFWTPCPSPRQYHLTKSRLFCSSSLICWLFSCFVCLRINVAHMVQCALMHIRKEEEERKKAPPPPPVPEQGAVNSLSTWVNKSFRAWVVLLESTSVLFVDFGELEIWQQRII